MKNVLIIASDFPPLAKVSVMRTAKFVKYLPSFGWNPIVLTTKINYTENSIRVDTTFSPNILKNIKVYDASAYYLFALYKLLLNITRGESQKMKFLKYTGVKFISNYILRAMDKLIGQFLFPDYLIGWYPFAVQKGISIIKRRDIHMLYSTSPSPVGHLIALSLAKKYNIPWVADFRDPWAYAYFGNLIWPIKLLDIRLEKKVLVSANRIVITLPKIIDEIKALRKEFDSTQCFVILNGYDEEDFKDISPHIFKQFTIVYTGRLHESRRSPYHLFAALNSIFQEQPDLKSKIKVVFIGDKHPFMLGLVKKYKLEGCVEMLGYLEHKKALSYICGASVLFLLTEETKDTEVPFQGKDVIPAKLYEYLRARKPILALVPEDSDCAHIIQDTHSGIVVEPIDYQKAKKVILDMYEKYERGQLRLKSNNSLIQQYERKILTGSLAKIFNDLLVEREN